MAERELLLGLATEIILRSMGAAPDYDDVDKVEQFFLCKRLLKHPINAKLRSPCNDRREG